MCHAIETDDEWGFPLLNRCHVLHALYKTGIVVDEKVLVFLATVTDVSEPPLPRTPQRTDCPR